MVNYDIYNYYYYKKNAVNSKSLMVTRIQDFCVALSACMLCWLVSFVLVMLEVIESGQFVRNKAILFVPMWVGSAIGILSVVAISLRICYNVSQLSTPCHVIDHLPYDVVLYVWYVCVYVCMNVCMHVLFQLKEENKCR